MNRNLSLLLIACGWVAALVSALLTIYIVHLGESPVALIEAAILFGLGFGIYRKSRVCAVITLVYFVIEKIVWYRFLIARVPANSSVLSQFWAPAIFFTILYVLGVIGTFAWHAAQTPADFERGGEAGNSRASKYR
jgi:hypothetical protein